MSLILSKLKNMSLLSILSSKCPNCKKGDIFNAKGNIFLLKMPKMNSHCTECNYKFEKETGFFFGAMFVSYALAVAEMIAILILLWMWLDLSPLNVFFTIAAVAIVVSTFNFRLSRTIWIYLFHRS